MELGRRLAHGVDIEADPRRAGLWYARAALGDAPGAAEAVAEMYASGVGGPSDPVIAAAWRRAARDGVSDGALPTSPPEAQLRAAAAPWPPEIAEAPLIVATPDGVVADVVWRPGDGGGASRFFVEVARLEGGAPRPVFGRYTTLTAMRFPMPADDDADAYVWRVIAVSEDGVYASAPWRPIAPTRAPADARVPEPPISPRYDVSVRFAHDDFEAAAFGAMLAEDLALAYIGVAEIRLDAPPARTRVVFHFRQDEAAARAVAALLSLNADAVTKAPIAIDTPPGAITISLAAP